MFRIRFGAVKSNIPSDRATMAFTNIQFITAFG
jgi:hypothetical protein